MSKTNTKATINANVKQNGVQAITGQILNSVLNAMVDDYGTQEDMTAVQTAISTLATKTEVSTALAAQEAKLTELEAVVNGTPSDYIPLPVSYIDGAFYQAGGGLTANGSSKYTEAVDVSSYSKIRIGGTMASGSGRYTLFYTAENAILHRYTEGDLSAGMEIDLTGVSYIKFSFVASSVPTLEVFAQGEKGLVGKIDDLYEDSSLLPNKRTIECWGDSLTAAGVYERVIADYVGDDYAVLNCGIAGETPIDICARIGGLSLFLKNDVTLPANTADVTIGNFADSGLEVINTLGIKENTHTLKMQAVADDKVNPLVIDGVECNLAWRGAPVSPTGYYTLCRRENGTSPVTLKAGTQIFPYAPKHLRNPRAVIIWMGTNVGGSWDITSTEGIESTLVKQIKSAIMASGTENFVVVGLHLADTQYRDNLEAIMYKEFGITYFNLRKYVATDALRDAGLTPTAADTAAMNAGNCPPQLLKDGTHFTDAGYAVVGQKILERLIDLGIVE